MANHPDQSDIIGPTEAMALMGIRSKATFYEVLKRIARQYGRDLRHKTHPLSRTSFYLRSEVLAYVRGEWGNPSDSGA